MNRLILFLSKIISIILNKLGKGSVYPGNFAHKLNKNIFRYFKLPSRIIFVTGTNGKSTTSNTLANLYKEAGFKVGHNLKGSNLRLGILTCLIENSKINGNITADVLILEVDERYVKHIYKDVPPTHIIITNISRDQPPRQGNFDFIYEEIKKGVDSNVHLILNADDPIVTRFSVGHKGNISYYGLAETKFSKPEDKIKYYDNLDSLYCPVCNKKLKFNYVHYGSVGSYFCKHNHFERPTPEYESKLIDNFTFEINNIVINMPNHFLYNIYNLSACYVMAKSDNIDDEVISKVLSNLQFKRIDLVNFKNKTFHFLLSKNENSVSFNQSLDYIKKENTKKSIVIGFERVSRRYNLTDLSWLWDIDFEVLNDDNIKNIICTGKFAKDIAVRLKYAIKDKKKIKICIDTDDLVNYIEKTDKTTENIYCLFCFELEIKIKNIIKEIV